MSFPALIVDGPLQGLPTIDAPGTPADDQQPHKAEQRRPRVQPPRASQSAAWSLILVLGLGAASYLTEWWLPRQGSIGPEVEIYVLRPLLWAALAGLASFAWLRLPGRPLFRWILPIAGLLAGLFHVAVLVIAGLFVGFGRTPSLASWVDYPLTAASLGAVILGTEVTRAYLAVAWQAISRRTSFVAVTVLVFVAGTPLSLFSGLDNAERFFRIGGGRLAPALVLSGALTWMAARGGPSPAIAYSAVLTSFWWFFVILPDLSWTISLLVGCTVPLIAMWIARSVAEDALEEAALLEDERSAHARWLGWAVAGVLAVAIIGLASGAFGVRPFIVTGTSMEPTLQAGDLVLVWEGAKQADLNVGDIAKVEVRGFPVVHRIVSMGSDDEGPVLITQGDNVRGPDPPVRPDEVDGKVIIGIPWIGQPVLWTRSP